jgi:hypothetical protein
MGRDHLGDLRYRGEDNIMMGIQSVGCEDVDWVHRILDWLQWLGLVNMVKNH